MKHAPGLVLLLAAALLTWWWLRPAPHRAPVSPPAAPAVPSPAGSATPPLGDRMLSGYGQPDRPPEKDLTALAQVMENYLLLVKGAGNRPLSANEDWAESLRGRNLAQERFLSDRHPALNQRGQLVDRWGTPLFFHAVGEGRFDLRSAGPDRTMWTEDDLHRNSDGTFRRGTELNPSSLYRPGPETGSATR